MSRPPFRRRAPSTRASEAANTGCRRRLRRRPSPLRGYERWLGFYEPRRPHEYSSERDNARTKF